MIRKFLINFLILFFLSLPSFSFFEPPSLSLDTSSLSGESLVQLAVWPAGGLKEPHTSIIEESPSLFFNLLSQLPFFAPFVIMEKVFHFSGMAVFLRIIIVLLVLVLIFYLLRLRK